MRPTALGMPRRNRLGAPCRRHPRRAQHADGAWRSRRARGSSRGVGWRGSRSGWRSAAFARLRRRNAREHTAGLLPRSRPARSFRAAGFKAIISGGPARVLVAPRAPATGCLSARRSLPLADGWSCSRLRTISGLARPKDFLECGQGVLDDQNHEARSGLVTSDRTYTR
jgi:hypothetical protein